MSDLLTEEGVYRRLFAESLDLMGAATSDGRLLRLNPAWERLLGFPAEAMLGRRLVDWVHPDDVEATEQAIQDLARGGRCHDFQNRCKDREGRYHWLEWRGTSPIPSGITVFTARDISARKALEAELERTNHRHGQVASMSSVGSWELSLGPPAELYWDPITCAIHDVPPGFVPDLERAVEYYAPEARPVVQAALDRAVAHGESWAFELPLTTATGREVWVEATGCPVYQDATVVRIVGAFRDVSEERRRAMTLEHARERAEAAVAAKSRFLANMSHELRTPMTGVLGMLDSLLDSPMSEVQLSQLRIAKDSAEGLLQILNDILDYSKLEADAVALEPLPTEARGWLRASLAPLERLAAERGLELSCEVASSVPAWLTLDPTRVRQVLVNLVGNGLKFTEQGGVHVSLRYAEGELELAVRDTGIGIEPEHIQRLFARFEQADDSTTRRFGGTGLGLAISRQLMEAMAGSLEASSQVGRGSTFVARLPAPPCEAPARSASDDDERPALPHLDILVAEDNRVNQMVVERLLKRHGHQVTLVSDGAEALEKLAQQRFDLVLMDIQMPNMDGVEACRRIRASSDGIAALPIVALTAHALAEEEQRYRACGMDGYATKPLDWAQLEAAMAEALGRRRGQEG